VAIRSSEKKNVITRVRMGLWKSRLVIGVASEEEFDEVLPSPQLWRP